MSQVNQAQHGIASSPGGGVAPTDVTLQLAYDNGNTIDETAGRPVVIANAGAIVDALLQLVASGVGAETIRALQITHDGSAPSADAGIVDLTMNDPTGSWCAFGVESLDTNPNQRILRVYPPGRGALWLELTPGSLYFLVPRADQAYAFVHSSEGKALLLQTTRALAGDGSTVGVLKVGPEFGPDNVDGGVTIEGVNADGSGSCTGRVKIETHALGADVATDRRGALQLPNVGGVSNALECDPPAEGDAVLRLDEVSPPEVFRTKGFRGYREGDYGLFARGYQRTFEDTDLSGGVLTVDHNLDTRAPVVAIYDDAGNLVPIVSAPAFPSIAEGADPDNQLAAAITATNITGTWRITVLGF